MHPRRLLPLLSLLAVAAALAACETPPPVQTAEHRVCPDWSAPSAAGYENRHSSNFGCASQTNLQRMVANPLDLVAGRTPGPADSEPEVLAVERYRQDKVKGGSSDKKGGGFAIPVMATGGGQ